MKERPSCNPERGDHDETRTMVDVGRFGAEPNCSLGCPTQIRRRFHLPRAANDIPTRSISPGWNTSRPSQPADLMKITPDNLKGATQEQVDQIYARLTAGPIPDGVYDGQMFFPKGTSERARLAEIVGGGIKGFIVDRKAATLEHIGEFIWKGKSSIAAKGCFETASRISHALKPIVGPNVEKIQKLDVDGKDAWLLFPAKLYCGQSLLDGRRESVIIDYAFTDDLPGYREMPDVLAGQRRIGDTRRDSHGSSRVLSGTSLHQEGLRIEFQPLQQSSRGKGITCICRFWGDQRRLLGRQSTHDGHGQQGGCPTCPVNGYPVKRCEPVNHATDGQAVDDETGMSDHDDGIGFRM